MSKSATLKYKKKGGGGTMNSKVSKIIILACTCSSLSASEFWASGVSINSGWSAYL